jgi:hypothetical protein
MSIFAKAGGKYSTTLSVASRGTALLVERLEERVAVVREKLAV